MKRLSLLILLITISTAPFAQSLRPVSRAQQQSIINKIISVESNVRTIQCNFVQTKRLSMLNDKMVSRGKMIYQRPNSLRWEYTSPYNYLFIINGAKVFIKSGGKRNAIDVKSSRIFQEITRIMMNSVTGKSLMSSSDFYVKMYASGDDWVADLTPKKRQMKNMFSTIRIYFDSNKSIVSKIEMFEKGGDKTEIELRNVQINTRVNEKAFDLD
jgi:outer membrane lipoprotein carrier protein